MFRRYLSTHRIPTIPEPPVWQFPEGFTVHSVAQTRIRAIDNFLSRDEAQQIIDTHRESVRKSTVIGPDGSSIVHDHRNSSDTFIQVDADSLIQMVVCRAAALLGLPVGHVEKLSITRYKSGEYYKSHLDHDGSVKADRLYTVLIYLNDLKEEEGGGTLFNKLNLVTHPVCGRAIIWANCDSNRKVLAETEHSSMPVLKEGVEKWVIQMWFRSYKLNSRAKYVERADNPAGLPLEPSALLPPGISISVGETHAD
jgi:prolyl 4-hydroxylase